MLALRNVTSVASAGAALRCDIAVVYFFVELVLKFLSRFQGLVSVPQILDFLLGFYSRVVGRN